MTGQRARRRRARNGEAGKIRKIYVPDNLWEETGRQARHREVSMNTIVREALREALGMDDDSIPF